MSYAALIRPVIDRVYMGLRSAGEDRIQAVYDEFKVRRGFECSFYFGLLARPMPAGSFAAATTYGGSDMTGELEQGVAEVDAEGTWRLTGLGRELALAVQSAYGEWAAEFWDRTLIETMPGLAVVPRLAELVGRLLAAGRVTGGPAFWAAAPVYEPPGATPGAVPVHPPGRAAASPGGRAPGGLGWRWAHPRATAGAAPRRPAAARHRRPDQPAGRAHLPGAVARGARRVAGRAGSAARLTGCRQVRPADSAPSAGRRPRARSGMTETDVSPLCRSPGLTVQATKKARYIS
jgi:hypothetical protein